MTDKNTHAVPVVDFSRLSSEPHPYADRLVVFRMDGMPVVHSTETLGGLWAWVQPDMVFGGKRVRVKNIRGVNSFGFFVEVNHPDLNTVTRFDDEQEGEVGFAGPGIPTGPEKYDVDRAHNLFEPGEDVVVTEKLDGSNCRVVWHDGKHWVKSRKQWVDPAKTNVFWPAIQQRESVLRVTRNHPGLVVFGEVFGNTNRIKYGPNRFKAYDLWYRGEFDPRRLLRQNVYHLPLPMTMLCGFDVQALDTLARGPSFENPGCIREGVVVTPVWERVDQRGRRVITKFLNPDFLK